MQQNKELNTENLPSEPHSFHLRTTTLQNGHYSDNNINSVEMTNINPQNPLDENSQYRRMHQPQCKFCEYSKSNAMSCDNVAMSPTQNIYSCTELDSSGSGFAHRESGRKFSSNLVSKIL